MRLIFPAINYQKGVQGPCTRFLGCAKLEDSFDLLSEEGISRFRPDLGRGKVMGLGEAGRINCARKWLNTQGYPPCHVQVNNSKSMGTGVSGPESLSSDTTETAVTEQA